MFCEPRIFLCHSFKLTMLGIVIGATVENSSGEVLVERVSLLEEEGGLSLEGGSLGGGGTLEEGLGMSGLVRQNEVNEIRDISSLNSKHLQNNQVLANED